MSRGKTKIEDHAERRLRTVGEVAEYLAISRSKTYQLMDAGTLPFVKLGKSRRIRWCDVIRLVETNIVGGASVAPSDEP